jgi:deoxyribonuclease V
MASLRSGKVNIKTLHAWDLTPDRASEIQLRIKSQVSATDGFTQIECIAGVDVSYKVHRGEAIVAVLSFPTLELIEHCTHVGDITFPYIPGLFSFREIPLLIPALEQIKTVPQLILADGHGIAHPNRLGLASHLGILTDIPTIGCAKSKFIGTYKDPLEQRGAYSFLYHEEERIGAVVRTRTNTKPVFVSTGHKISLEKAIEVVLMCTTKYRLPEPLRWAHRMGKDH